jgi:hypothetical protein
MPKKEQPFSKADIGRIVRTLKAGHPFRGTRGQRRVYIERTERPGRGPSIHWAVTFPARVEHGYAPTVGDALEAMNGAILSFGYRQREAAE